MIELFSLEFWIGIGFIIDLVLLGLLLTLSRRINRLAPGRSSRQIPDEPPSFQSGLISEINAQSTRKAEDIIEMLQPLVQESKNTAQSFESQIKEKKEIISKLNDALDNRIININLLLSRADALHGKIDARLKSQQREQWQPRPSMPATDSTSQNRALNDQQNEILDLYHQGTDVQTIASTLNLPKGEVQLVVDLKAKLMAMEQTR